MYNLFKYISKNVLSTILVTVLTGVTVTTSAAGTAKLLGTMNSFKSAVPEVKDVQALDNEISKTPTPTKEKTVTKTVKTMANATVNLLKKSPTLAPIIPPSSNNSQNNNSCVISLFGKQYDVFALQTTHSGGNIFRCNTDMTATYQSKHGTNVSRMQKYLLASGGTTNSPNSGGPQPQFAPGSTSTQSSTGSGSDTEIRTENHREDDNDREDQEEKEDENHVEQEFENEFD